MGAAQADLAREVLAAASAGEIAPALLEALAGAVLDQDRVRLALEVRDGGPHAVRRAIELASLVLAEESAPTVSIIDTLHQREPGNAGGTS